MKAIIYGFDETQYNLIKNQIGFEEWDIIETHNHTDIVAIDAGFFIVNIEALSVEQVEDIWEVLRFNNRVDQRIYFVDEQESTNDTFKTKAYIWDEMLRKLPHDLSELNSLKSHVTGFEVSLKQSEFIALDIECCDREIVKIEAIKYCEGLEIERFNSWIRPRSAIRSVYERMLEKTNVELAEEPSFELIAQQLFHFIGGNLLVMYREVVALEILMCLFGENNLSMQNKIIDIVEIDKLLEHDSKRKSLGHLAGKWLDIEKKDYAEKIAEIFASQQNMYRKCINDKEEINDCFLDGVVGDLLDSFMVKENELVVMRVNATDRLSIEDIINRLKIAGCIITELGPSELTKDNLMGELIYESRGKCQTVRRGAPVYVKVGEDSLERRIVFCDTRKKKLSDESIRAVTQSIHDWFQYDDRPYQVVSSKGLYAKYLIFTDEDDLWKRFIDLSVFDEDEVDYDYIDMRIFRTRIIEHFQKNSTRFNCLMVDSYILPEDRKNLNILEPFRKDFMTYAEKNKIRWHRHANRLNSSQVMCFNLFYPLVRNKQLEAITGLMGCDDEIDYESVAFEKLSELEPSNRRRTNFDFYFESVEGKKFFFEIKYTEDGFGTTKNDLEHREKFEEVYKPFLMQHSGISDTYKEQAKFFEHYQIMRNLIHMDENSYVIFIYPKENMKVRQQARKAMFEIVESSWAKHFSPITLESIIDGIPAYLGDQLSDYYRNDFSSKYII